MMTIRSRTDPEVNAKTRDFGLHFKAKAETKDLINKAKAKVEDLKFGVQGPEHATLSSRHLEANDMTSPTLAFVITHFAYPGGMARLS